MAPARVDRVTTIGFRLADGDLAALEAAFLGLEAEALKVLAETGLPAEAAQIQRMADGRFIGQGFDLPFKLPPGPYAGEAARTMLREAFEAAYRVKFTRAPPNVPLEFIAVRVAAQVAIQGGRIGALPETTDLAPARRGTRPAWFAEAGGFVDATVYDRDALGAGATFPGPALVEDAGSTLVVGPGATCRVTPGGSIIMQLHQETNDAR
ncbi:MAG: hypothetical protein WDN49_17985 [Acetobacteraceae bacterium]